jgi:hypothetical protein
MQQRADLGLGSSDLALRRLGDWSRMPAETARARFPDRRVRDEEGLPITQLSD